MIARQFLMHLLTIFLVVPCAFAKDKPHHPCPATNQRQEWSATCFETTKAGRQIQKQYRKKVVFDRRGYAAIVIASPPELVVVNRRGFLVAPEMAHLRSPDFDFEAGDVPGDIANFGRLVGFNSEAKKFKCGYYRTGQFRVLVPPVYNLCDPFKGGTALVCIGCTSPCDTGDCHESDFVGGGGLVVNEKNEVLKRFALPTLPLCSRENSKVGSDKNCRARPDDPFSPL